MSNLHHHEARGRTRGKAGTLRRDGFAGWMDRLDPTTRERLEFLGAFLREPVTVGSVLPSSPDLAEAMIEGCDFDRPATIVELGPGTGAFTGKILDRVHPGSTFFALELNERHVAGLRRRFSSLEVHLDSAERIRQYLKLHGKESADYVLSGLPWGNFAAPLQDRIMREVVAAIRPGGLFCTFSYIQALALPRGRRFRRTLHGRFSSVEQSPVVWKNLPPAMVYRCRR